MSQTFLLHAVAGALANVLSITLVFPFDTARTRLQTQDKRKAEISILVIRDVIKNEGWSGLYMGWKSLVLSLSITNFVYFYVFNCLKSAQSIQTVQQDFLFGIIAGCLAVFVSNPFWVVNTRLKLQGVRIGGNGVAFKGASYDGIVDCLSKVYKQEGVCALFAGFKSSLVLVSNPAINFMMYEFLKRFFLVNLISLLNSSLLYFTFGGLSKFLATTITYPLQVVQTRTRAGLPIWSAHSRKFNYLSEIMFLFRGLESKLTQTVLTSAIMFLTYEHLKSLLFLFTTMFTNLKCLQKLAGLEKWAMLGGANDGRSVDACDTWRDMIISSVLCKWFKRLPPIFRA